MDSNLRKRWTWEHRSELSDLPKDLSHHAALYIRLCDGNELRMRQVVDDLQDVSAKLQRLQSRSDRCRVVGVLIAALGLGAVMAALITQFTGGLSLAVTAAAGYAAAAGTVFAFRTKQKTTEEERVKKVKEFLEIVTLLQNQLENITKLCEDVQREAAGEETETMSLNLDILQPFLKSARVRASVTAGFTTELSEQCENVFNQFRTMKRKVEELRGGQEATETE